MDPNRKITKKFTKKFGSKVINRQYFHRKTGLKTKTMTGKIRYIKKENKLNFNCNKKFEKDKVFQILSRG